MIEAAPEKLKAYIQFNKRNQIEMAARMTVPCDVLTFNAACNRFLTKQWGYLQAKSFWAEANRVNSIDSACKGVPLNQVTKLIGALKNEIPRVPTEAEALQIALKYGIEDCAQFKYSLDEIVALAVKTIPLCLEKPKSKQIDWADQIFVPLVNGWLHQIADYLLGDEYQDFNPVQHEAFIALLGNARGGILFDDRQQIYGWRGAVDNGADKMVERLQAEVHTMSVSRRCAKVIATQAQTLVPDFRAHESAPEGKIDSMNFDNAIRQGKEGDAFLSRTNAPNMSTCFAFLRRGITARIEGRDIGAQLDGVIKQVGETYEITSFLDKLEIWVQARIAKAKGFNAQATIDYVCDQAETLKVLAENCNTVPEMSAKIQTIFEDSNGNERPSVKCSTVHKAKGLEWNNVYILNDTFKTRATASPAAQREEQNIKYVAWTRARTNLNFVTGLNKAPNP